MIKVQRYVIIELLEDDLPLAPQEKSYFDMKPEQIEQSERCLINIIKEMATQNKK